MGSIHGYATDSDTMIIMIGYGYNAWAWHGYSLQVAEHEIRRLRRDVCKHQLSLINE